MITPDRLGVYPVICVELCGLGHSLMRSEAIVMSTANYAAWYKGASAPPDDPGGAGEARPPRSQLFNTSGCVACHTFPAIPGCGGQGRAGAAVSLTFRLQRPPTTSRWPLSSIKRS